jgi:hypothetical protein
MFIFIKKYILSFRTIKEQQKELDQLKIEMQELKQKLARSRSNNKRFDSMFANHDMYKESHQKLHDYIKLVWDFVAMYDIEEKFCDFLASRQVMKALINEEE